MAFGESKSFKAWAADPRCAVSWSGLRNRLQQGWDPERAITEPSATAGPGTRPILLSAFGETKSVLAWSADPRCAVSRTMLRKRLAAGMRPEAALAQPGSRRPIFGVRAAFGEEKTLAAWHRDPRCEVSYCTLQLRMADGWDMEAALKRVGAGLRILDINGTAMTLAAWSRQPGVAPSRTVIRERLDEGWSPKDAVFKPLEANLYEGWGEKKRLNHWIKDPRCVVRQNATLLSRLRAGIPVEVAVTTPVGNYRSYVERQMAAYVEDELGLAVERNTRKIIGPRELDVYVPSLQIAIEFNGVKWHAERYVRTTTYHYDKWAGCAAKGIRLFQVWDDDWMARRPIVKRMLAAKLGRSDEARVHARATTVDFEDSVDDFLEANHIQGRATGTTFNIGLRSAGELVAVASFQRRSKWGHWLLTRYATSVRVPGGFTKCLGFLRRSVPCKEIRTFSDNCVSDGGLYRQAGFVEGRPLPPDYSYVVDDRRVHKFNYRLARFRADPDLLYEDGKTEAELAAMNDLPRIWDAGKRVWVLSIP